MAIGNVLEKLARAFLDKERYRLGIPQREQEAAAAEESSLLRRAQAAKALREAEQAPAEHALRSRLTEAQIRNLDEPNRASAAGTWSVTRDGKSRINSVTGEVVPLKESVGAVGDNVGSFEDYMKADPKRRAEIEAARKSYGQADDRALRPIVPIVIQTPSGPQVLDRNTRTASPIQDTGGNTLGTMPTAEMRNIASRQGKAGNSLKALDVLGEQLITEKTAIAQRVKGTGMTAEAAIANLPKFRAYQDARRAMAINLAAIMNQGRPTEPDAQAAADIIPDVFRDTPESAEIKRAFIQQMLASPDDARDMLVDFKMKYGGGAGATSSGAAPTFTPAVEERLRRLGLPQ